MIEGLSGPFANAGGAVFRNFVWATERVNARGGVPLPGGARPLVVERFDSKGQIEAALSVLRLALDRGIVIVAQGNSSAAAGAIIDAVDLDAMRTATVRNLIATLKTHGRNHLLVVESGGALPLQVRGVISRAQIERQLGTPISLIEVAGSFAELRQLLT